MPPKGVSKAVSKKCPDCKKQVAVASKLCPTCSHQFFEERRKSTASNPSEAEEAEDLSLRDMKPSRGVGTAGNVSGMMALAAGKGDLGAPEGKRRSERVKREKPNFYDALEYENQMRKARKERQKEDPPNPTGRVKRERKVKNNSEPVSVAMYRSSKVSDISDYGERRARPKERSLQRTEIYFAEFDVVRCSR